MTQVTHQLCTPLLQCSPFAQILVGEQKGQLCDYCFQQIEQKYSCSKCEYAHYCSQGCYKNDLSVHGSECVVRLVNKIKERFDEENYPWDEQSTSPGFKETANCFPYNDIVDYTLLFFRVLQQLKNVEEKEAFEASEDQVRRTSHQTRFGPFHASVGNLERRISWKDIPVSFSMNRKLKESRSSDYFSTCQQDYAEMSEEETAKLDEMLGFEMPSDEYFENILCENEVKCILSKIIDEVEDLESDSSDELESDETELGSSLNTPIEFEEENHDLHEQFMKDLQKRGIDLSQMPYEQAMTQYSRMYEWFKKSYRLAREKRFQESSQEHFDRDLNNEFESISFEMLPTHSSRTRSYVSSYLVYDTNLISENPQESLNALKTEYRLIHLAGASKKSSNYDSELDYYFGFWIGQIRRILALSDVAKIYGPSGDIEKAFYVTIRYSIAIITDEFGLLPVARAIYLPLTQFEHCCFANTSLVFDRNYYLKVYYNPSEKLVLSDNKLVTLGVDSIKVNFLNDITTKEDSHTNYIRNRIRMLACKCERCKLTKKLVKAEAVVKLFEDSDSGNEHEDEFLSSDIFPEYEDLPSLILPEQSNGRDYDFELFRLKRANERYGNRSDLEYSFMFHELLIEVLESYRDMFGYYHTQCTVVLLLINHCNFIIIQSKKNRVEMFYRLKYTHRYLTQLIDSVAITHGSQHQWLSKLDQIHQICHKTMQLIFNEQKNDILRLDKENQTKKFCSQSISSSATGLTDLLISFDHCSQLLRLPDNELQVIRELCEEDSLQSGDYFYNPYDMFDQGSNLNDLMETGESHDQIDNQMKLIFDYFNQITVNFQFRFL